jgi:archaellin
MIKIGTGKQASDDVAFTRLGAAIIILAFIVVAALFTYFLSKAGIFTK